jgi:hypothetical protein
MAYIVEPFDSLILNLSEGPYSLPEPLEIELEFSWLTYPPLPWVIPSITVEYSAPILAATHASGSNLIPLTAGVIADDLRICEWGNANHANSNWVAPLIAADVSDTHLSILLSEANPVSNTVKITWLESAIADNQRSFEWGDATTKDRSGFNSSWVMVTRFRDRVQQLDWFTVHISGTLYDDSDAILSLLNTDTPLSINLDATGVAVANESATKIRLKFGFTKPKRPIVPHDITRRLTARPAHARDTSRAIPWGAGTSVWNNWNLPYPVDNGPPIPPDPIDPPIRKVVYLIMNTLSVIDLETSTPLDIQHVSIGLDIDSISWKFSGTVYGQATLDLIAPGEDGMKDISVTINGHAWVFSIEGYTSDEKFPTQKFNVSGVSRTQYMAAPYAPVNSFTNTSNTTAAQVCENVLTDTGFTLNWPTLGDEDLPDWSIPTGALSYRDKSPAQVIGQIITAAGGVMIPSMNSDGWTIQPRYTTPPWQWDTVTPDAAIYIGMVRSRSAQYEPGQAYDACYVSGINQGVAADVQLTGSGGLNPMPDIFDDLITEAAPAISRGKTELASAGSKVVETLSVIIPESGAAPGILKAGMIVSVTYEDPAKDYIALVLSTSISVQRAGGAEIYQNVTLERAA